MPNRRPRGYQPQWKPRARTCELLTAVDRILARYAVQLPLTIRRVWYSLISDGVLVKEERTSATTFRSPPGLGTHHPDDPEDHPQRSSQGLVENGLNGIRARRGCLGLKSGRPPRVLPKNRSPGRTKPLTVPPCRSL